MKTNPLLTLIALLTLIGSAYAQPEYVNYQGYLKDSEGEPLPTGPYTMEFNLYSEAIGDGSLIWGPYLYDDGAGDGHAKQVIVTNGRFNVILGPKDTAGRYLSDSFVGNDAYVQIKIGDGDPIEPRQQILSTPFAFEAANAGKLNNVAPVNYFNPAGMIAPFAGSAANTPDGWLICDGTELVSTDYPELYATIGKTWGGRQESAGEVTIDYFNLPDLRGMFLRGANQGRADGYADPNAATRLDPDGAAINTEEAGSLQGQAISVHQHVWANADGSGNTRDLYTWNVADTRINYLDYTGSVQIHDVIGSPDFEDNHLRITNSSDVYTEPTSTKYRSGESRPNNASVNYIIKL